MWAGFAVVWELGATASTDDPFFTLWGIPFVVVGAYFAFGRFVYKRRRKLRTAYGLTEDRAIVAVGSTRLYDSPVRNVRTSVERTRDGRHVSVTFGDGPAWWGGSATYGNTGMDFFMGNAAPVAFYDVADVHGLLAALDRVRG